MATARFAVINWGGEADLTAFAGKEKRIGFVGSLIFLLFKGGK